MSGLRIFEVTNATSGQPASPPTSAISTGANSVVAAAKEDVISACGEPYGFVRGDCMTLPCRS
jgi:hypothetical protein